MEKTIKIELLFENGKHFDTTEITYFLFQPELLIIDNKYFIKQLDSTKYKQTIPQFYKRKD
jgi:hypothetical protein